MPIQFSCPKCAVRLSLTTSKPGDRLDCPKCKSPITVPGNSPRTVPPKPVPAKSAPAPAPASKRFPVLVVSAGAVLLLAAGITAAVIALRTPPETPVAHAPGSPKTPIADAPGSPKPAQQPRPPIHQPPVPPEPPSSQPELAPEPRPVVEAHPQPAPEPAPMVSAVPKVVAEGPERAPPPRLVARKVEPPRVFDRFGNPVGDEFGLARGGEFKGKKLLFWSGFEAGGRVFFGATNPLWKALEDKGFVVRREFGRFNPAWLKDTDQLWILSTGKLELPPGITPELLDFALTQLPAAAIPSGFTLDEYRFVVRATLDCALSPTHPLDEKSFRAIEDFVKAGHGLCLLAEDEPFTFEANELAKRLFGSGVSGNFLADKVGAVRGRGITPLDARRFGAAFEMDDHALLTGVNFLFEGITVSNVAASNKLDVALKASDGKTLIAVSKVPGQRVVIDCGFTRYCHGPDPRVSYIQKTPGTVRLGQNIAAFLAGKDAAKP